MDSSSSFSSNDGCEKEASAAIQSRRAEFFANYKRQSFSLPDSIIFYMATNPTSSEVYQKMIESCKYFYVKNPVLVISKLWYLGDGKWRLDYGKEEMKSPPDFSKIASKFWITDSIHFQPDKYFKRSVKQKSLSSVIPKLYRCDAYSLLIHDQIISFHDLSFLVSSAESIAFDNVTVKDKNGSTVAVEKIVQVAVKAERMYIHSKTSRLDVTSNTMKELIKLPHFLKLEIFEMNRIPEAFDIETFYDYMKQNRTTKIWLNFDVYDSKTYKNRLEEIIDEILATESRDYKTPYIWFLGSNAEKQSKLLQMHYSK